MTSTGSGLYPSDHHAFDRDGAFQPEKKKYLAAMLEWYVANGMLRRSDGRHNFSGGGGEKSG